MSDVPLLDVAEARALIANLLPTLDAIVRLRADAAELAATGRGGPGSALGGLPELKAAQARLDELMTDVQASGAQIKGLAPLLLDLPSAIDSEPVLLCWLEGERTLEWYHRHDLGIAGRRRIPPASSGSPGSPAPPAPVAPGDGSLSPAP